MRKTKSLLALLCAVVAAFVLAIPAFAASGNHTVTITSKTSGHTYSAYQIFAGDLDQAEDTLANVTWGDGINSSKIGDLLADLQANAKFGKGEANAFYGISASDEDAAAKVAKALDDDVFRQTGSGATVEDSAALDEFANVVSKYLSSTTTGSQADPTESGTGDDITYTYTLSGFASGYYMIMDGKDSPSAGEDGSIPAKTKYILNIVHDVTIEAKADQPPLEKVIDDASLGTDNHWNNAAIGDDVPFKITSRVPNMDGYDSYWFVVNDTLSKGLTYNSDVAITIGGQSLKSPADFEVTSTTSEETGVTTLEIVFKSFYTKWHEHADEVIEITYSAEVDTDAVIGNDGNENSAHLIFSNDPNVTYNGDKPGLEDVFGRTPDSKTFTYVTGLIINKVDGEKDGALTGAQFKIEGETLNTVLITGTKFVPTASEEEGTGTYYKLKNETYTDQAPTPKTAANYAEYNSDNPEQTPTYKLVTYTNFVQTHGENVEYTAWVDDNGVLQIDGLSAGTYTITELVAPDGYNKADPIQVTITWTKPAAPSTECTWGVAAESMGSVTTDGNRISVDIENFSGATLPSTGGIGTTIFYAVGATCVIGAGVVLVSRYRANRMK